MCGSLHKQEKNKGTLSGDVFAQYINKMRGWRVEKSAFAQSEAKFLIAMSS
jgi:hypothetical protein